MPVRHRCDGWHPHLCPGSFSTLTRQTRLIVQITPEQRAWLVQQSGPFRSMSAILRDLIDQARKAQS